MDKETAKFYAEKGLHIEKLVARKPKEVSEAQVMAAACKTYDDIQADLLKVKDIQLARTIWERAKHIKTRETDNILAIGLNAKELIDKAEFRLKVAFAGAIFFCWLSLLSLWNQWGRLY